MRDLLKLFSIFLTDPAVEIAIESKPEIIGFSEFISSEEDEFKDGFLVKRI